MFAESSSVVHAPLLSVLLHTHSDIARQVCVKLYCNRVFVTLLCGWCSMPQAYVAHRSSSLSQVVAWSKEPGPRVRAPAASAVLTCHKPCRGTAARSPSSRG